MNIVLIFDVDGGPADAAKQVKSCLSEIGYFDNWTIKSDNEAQAASSYNLPSNCVWRSNIEMAQAKFDITAAIALVNKKNGQTEESGIKLARCLALQASPWWGIPGALNI